jgi:hypothetical protein
MDGMEDRKPHPSRWFAWTLGLLTIIVVLVASLIAWTNRVQLFVIPAAWKEVLRLEPGKDLDRALARLIALQDKAYRPGHEYHLEKVRARGGRTMYFLCWGNDPQAMKQVLQRDGTLHDQHLEQIHLLLDERGRIVESELPVFEGHVGGWRHSIVRNESIDHDELRTDDCFGCGYPKKFSFDDLGFVPEGTIRTGNLEVPVCEWPNRPPEPDRERISRYLHSPRKGDVHRALTLIENSLPKSADLIRPLLSNPDREIRARAVALMTAAVEMADDIVPFLSDKDPIIRLTAAEAIHGKKGWVQQIRKLTDDPDRDVALGAHQLLCEARNLEIARSSFLHLVELDAVDWGFDLRRMATAALSEPMVLMLERQTAHREIEGSGILPGLTKIAEEYPPELLQPFTARLVNLYRQMEKQEMESPAQALAGIIARIDDPVAEAFIEKLLSLPVTDQFEAPDWLLNPLLERSAPCRSAKIIQVLEGLPESIQNPGPMILAKWKVPGACERLLRQAKEDGGLSSTFWHWAPDSLLRAAKALGDEFNREADSILESREEERKILEEHEKAGDEDD